MILVPMSRRGSELSRLFDDTFDRFFQSASAPSDAASPALDVIESPKGWSVRLDMPGVDKEDVKVAIDGRNVSIEGSPRKDDERREGERVLVRERQASRPARSLTLPAEVDQSASSAKMDKGVLTLWLARRGASEATHLSIN